MSERPSFEIAAAAMAKLDLRFGGEDIDQPRRLSELRLLATAHPRAVEDAVTRICRRWVRRPSVEELGQVLRDALHGLGHGDHEDMTPPTEVALRVDQVRTQLAGDGTAA